jgi:hypothetical protein
LSFLIGAIQQNGPYHQPGTRGRATNSGLVLEVRVYEAKTVIDHDFFIVLTVLLNIVNGPIGNAIELPQEVKHLALNQQAFEKVRNICTVNSVANHVIMNLGFMEESTMYNPNNLFPEDTIGSQPTEVYSPMEELSLKPPPPQEPVYTPQTAGESPVQASEGVESLVTRQEEALTIKFAIGKLNDYLLWFLMLLELSLLTRLLLKLIGANPKNLFAGFLYAFTDILLYPFLGIVPSPLIHPLNQPLEISTLVGMFVYFLIFFVLVRFLQILVSDHTSDDEVLYLKSSKATKERAFTSKFAITQVRSFYQNARGQLKSWLLFSVITITLGTLCIASIFIISYLGEFFPISENSTTTLTTIIAGGSLYIIALLSFLQNREAFKQIESYYTDKLIEAEKISQLTTLASRTPVSKAQEHINEKIISQILLPLGTVLDTTEKTVLGRGVPNLQKLDIWTAAEMAQELDMKVVPVGEDSSYPNMDSGLIVAQNP